MSKTPNFLLFQNSKYFVSTKILEASKKSRSSRDQRIGYVPMLDVTYRTPVSQEEDMTRRICAKWSANEKAHILLFTCNNFIIADLENR